MHLHTHTFPDGSVIRFASETNHVVASMPDYDPGSRTGSKARVTFSRIRGGRTVFATTYNLTKYESGDRLASATVQTAR